MRVVFDTNILISACWNPGGLEARALGMALSGSVTPCVTRAVWEEYRDVLNRAKFVSRADKIVELLLQLEARALTVQASEVCTIAADDDDNRFLECAAAAQAEWVVTGNLRDYPSEFGSTRIVNAREFLNAVLGPAFGES